jgi:hypothetical protein
MKSLLAPLAVLCLPLFLVAAPAPAPEGAKGDKVEYDVHNGHFVRNDAGLKGDSSYLVFTDRAAFDKVFGVAAVMRKQNFVPKDAFEKKMVVAVVKTGKTITEYKVNKVTAADGTLTIDYTTTTPKNGTGKYSSPLIVSVDRNKYKSVVFIENGKEADRVKVGK